MLDDDFAYVRSQIKNGRRFTIMRNPVGRMKIKLHNYWFGLHSKSYRLDEKQLQDLKLLQLHDISSDRLSLHDTRTL